MIHANSPFRNILDRRLLSAFEAGLTKKWFEKELSKPKLYQDAEEVKPLTLGHFAAPLAMWATWLIISTLIFIGELILFKYQRK